MLCTSFKLVPVYSDYDNEKAESMLVFWISGKFFSGQENINWAVEKWHAPTLPNLQSSNLLKLLLLYVWMPFGTKSEVNNAFGNYMSHKVGTILTCAHWKFISEVSVYIPFSWVSIISGQRENNLVSFILFEMLEISLAILLPMLLMHLEQRKLLRRDKWRFIQKLREDQCVSMPGGCLGMVVSVKPRSKTLEKYLALEGKQGYNKILTKGQIWWIICKWIQLS